MDLNDALAEFDAAETTLTRLEGVWQRLRELVPERISFVGGRPERREYEDLRRAFNDLVAGLPALGGSRISESPLPLDEIAQARLDAREIDEVELFVSVEQAVEAPGEAIREYRFRFNKARRSVVRSRIQHLLEDTEAQLGALVKRIYRDNEPITDPDWPLLVDGIREVERLMGGSMGKKGRWSDLRRHLTLPRDATCTTSQSTTGLR